MSQKVIPAKKVSNINGGRELRGVKKKGRGVLLRIYGKERKNYIFSR